MDLMNDILILHQDDDVLFNEVILDIINNGIPRQVYVRNNHFNSMSDLLFVQHFRLTKETVLMLLERIEDQLEYIHNLNNSVSPINQILVCLRYYATGGHQLSLAHFGGMHKSTVNRIIKRVSEAIASLAAEWIKFPDDEVGLSFIQRQFYDIAAFPRVVGAIDGTHIKIQSPGGNDAEIFRNRKHFFSINVQAVCDASYKIMNLVARWPGSTHDATILRNCNLRARFEDNHFPNVFLLGDSGYPMKSYLMTPLLDPRNEAERRYNESHIRTRVLIENTFGIWKRRFPILAYGCRVKVNLTLTIIIATAVLHNMARNNNEEEPPNDNEVLLNHLINNQYIDANYMGVQDANNNGFQIRRQLINNYFANL